ncbi:GTP-binding protein TypA [Vibrio azureus]|uniref:GTP-binding protein TypA n=1 Tax=Vibrio azureus NBRC 104587 TaxID=1219077 RepID=U3A4Y2_9VIBR|nr:GTP-binding protein [Vibrio azureus]AUI86638.1 GTP-binding protein TypA [Vibrio azureus]GAD75071.1 GTP-binding protein TypA [Vibrio azureus NBRC 104587]
MQHENIRNIAIIAHVDHGKTSLVDTLLRETTSLSRQECNGELLLDSNDQERERGITILSKVTAVNWKDHRINIIDTPGHADFSGEVERVIDMADAALIVVDAVEGPMPQTRFVAQKAIQNGLKILIAVNKVDRKEADPQRALDAAYDLLIQLGASTEQLDFEAVFCSARQQFSYDAFGSFDDQLGMAPLLDMMINKVSAPQLRDGNEPVVQVHQLDYSPYLGLIGVGRILSGEFHKGQKVVLKRKGCVDKSGVIRELFHSEGLSRVNISTGLPGDIIAFCGIENISISDVITTKGSDVELSQLKVDLPSVSVQFSVNDSPFAGKEGAVLQSKALAERLHMEATYDAALRVKDAQDGINIDVIGRGELHLGVLIENMRREGKEFCISRPKVLNDASIPDGQEPYDKCFINCESQYLGAVINELGAREANLLSSERSDNGQNELIFRGSKRGFLGLRHAINNLSGGTASLHTEEDGFDKKCGAKVGQRKETVMVSNGTGKALNHSLAHLQDRGRMMIKHGEQVFAGQIIGTANSPSDLWVNCRQGKQLARVWRTTADKHYAMKATFSMSLEQAMSWINDDELIEVTPQNIRLKKKALIAS